MKNKILLGTILAAFVVMILAINYEPIKIPPPKPATLVSFYNPKNGQAFHFDFIPAGQSYQQVFKTMTHYLVWSDKTEGSKRVLEYRNIQAYLGLIDLNKPNQMETLDLLFTFENNLLIKVEKKGK